MLLPFSRLREKGPGRADEGRGDARAGVPRFGHPLTGEPGLPAPSLVPGGVFEVFAKNAVDGAGVGVL